MNWILDNLQLLIVAAGGVAYWLNQRRQQKEESEQPRDEAPHVPGYRRPVERADEVDEQATRRIQEEIRRMIEQRRGATPPQPAPAMDEPPPVPRWDFESEEEAANTPPPPAVEDPVLVRQRLLMEQMESLQAQQRAARERADQVNFPGGDAAKAAAVAAGAVKPHSLLAELRNARSMRRAMVLREVLGPPVGLR